MTLCEITYTVVRNGVHVKAGLRYNVKCALRRALDAYGEPRLRKALRTRYDKGDVDGYLVMASSVTSEEARGAPGGWYDDTLRELLEGPAQSG